MPAIVTLTFNPCIDKSVTAVKLIPEKKLRCKNLQLSPGGGGINVARVIRRLGDKVYAIYPAGGHTGKSLTRLLDEEQVNGLPIPITRETRENWIVDEESTGNQFRFIMPGPVLSQSESELCLAKLESIEDIRFIVVSGSIPEGLPKNIFERISKLANNNNAKLIIDSSGDALINAVKQGAYLIKPSMSELTSLMQAFHLNNETPGTAARQLIDMGYCEAVVVSLGADGAILVTKKNFLQIPAPPIVKKSSTGAGDSLVAGIVHKMMQGEELSEAVQFGVACGSAATAHSGTAVFSKEEACRIYEQMQATFK